MANTASARKRARQADQRRAHNMGLRTQVRTAIKNVAKAIESGDRDAAAQALRRSASIIDRNAGKGIVHRNSANRQKSRLTAAVKAMA